MEEQLTASDLQEHVYCEVEIGLSQISEYDDSDQYPGALEKSKKKAALLTTDDIKRQYGVSDEVALKLVGYQQDIQAKFSTAIETVIDQYERYARVKQFLNDDGYVRSVFTEYIYRYSSPKDRDPKRYLTRSVLRACISASLLAIIVLLVRKQHIPFDNLGGWILSGVWAAVTLLYAMSIPRNYKTRSLLARVLAKR